MNPAHWSLARSQLTRLNGLYGLLLQNVKRLLVALLFLAKKTLKKMTLERIVFNLLGLLRESQTVLVLPQFKIPVCIFQLILVFELWCFVVIFILSVTDQYKTRMLSIIERSVPHPSYQITISTLENSDQNQYLTLGLFYCWSPRGHPCSNINVTCPDTKHYVYPEHPLHNSYIFTCYDRSYRPPSATVSSVNTARWGGYDLTDNLMATPQWSQEEG